MSARAEDLRMLRELTARLDKAEFDDDEASAWMLESSWAKPFREMLEKLRGGRLLQLSDKQRAWVRGIFEKVFDTPTYENAVSSGAVPRGKEVELLVDRMPKPLKPPTRRSP